MERADHRSPLPAALAAIANNGGEVDRQTLLDQEDEYNRDTVRLVVDICRRVFVQHRERLQALVHGLPESTAGPDVDVTGIAFMRKGKFITVCADSSTTLSDAYEAKLCKTARDVTAVRIWIVLSMTNKKPLTLLHVLDEPERMRVMHAARTWYAACVEDLVTPRDGPTGDQHPLDGPFCVTGPVLARALLDIGWERAAACTREERIAVGDILVERTDRNAFDHWNGMRYAVAPDGAWLTLRGMLAAFCSVMERLHATPAVSTTLIVPHEKALIASLLPPDMYVDRETRN